MSEAIPPTQEDKLVAGYLKYFYDAPTICPYEISDIAIYRQGQFGFMDDPLMACFLARGFRRNSNTLYTMVCPDCSACIPIRLPVAKFHPNRNQRRIIKKNKDLEVRQVPFSPTPEKLEMLGRFFASRYPGRDNTPESYYGNFFANNICATLEVEYRQAGQLLGVAIIDQGENWLNGVYFYFDPEQAWRSLGIFNILTLLAFCQQQGISFFYLGYLIKELSSMNYKATFKPYELFTGESWQLHL